MPDQHLSLPDTFTPTGRIVVYAQAGDDDVGSLLDVAGLRAVAELVVVFVEASCLANGGDKDVAHPPRTSAIAQPIAVENKLARVNDMRSFEGEESVGRAYRRQCGGRIVEKPARAGKLRTR